MAEVGEYAAESITRISVSIQFSTSRITTEGFLSLVVISGPMETVTIPGYFKKLFLGQTWPALWAIGIISAAVSTASLAPPLR